MQSGDEQLSLEALAREALRGVIDPEIGINIVDLGLVRQIVRAGNELHVGLIVTTPACPLGAYILGEAERALHAALPDSVRPEVELLRNVAWTPDYMSDAARQQLGVFR